MAGTALVALSLLAAPAANASDSYVLRSGMKPLNAWQQQYVMSLAPEARQQFIDTQIPFSAGSSVVTQPVAGAHSSALMSPSAASCFTSKYSFWHSGWVGNRTTEMGFTLNFCRSGSTMLSGVTMSSKWAYGNVGWGYTGDVFSETGVVLNQARGVREAHFTFGGGQGGDSDGLCGLGVAKVDGTNQSYLNACSLT